MTQRMSATFMQGDTLESLQYSLTDVNDNPIALLPGSSVTFQMYSVYPPYTDQVTAQAASIVTLSPAVVQYNWQTADVATPGVYYGRFIVTGPSGGTECFPPDQSLVINILQAR